MSLLEPSEGSVPSDRNNRTPLVIGPRAEDFIWASGIEDTFVPQVRTGHRALDEYELMGHYDHWKEDLDLFKVIGARAIRWGVPWYKVEPEEGTFDWSWTDKVIPYMVEDLGLVPILDLMHYGTPFWMRKEFDNEGYPEAVARYARAFAERYKGSIKWYTPLNEPVVNAIWCGKRGVWPPYLRGDRGYIRIMTQLAKGIVKTVRALLEVDPSLRIVHVEASGLSRAQSDDLQTLAVEDQHRGYLCFDLITGRVTKDHPLYPWLIRNGTSRETLLEIGRERIALDIMGLNFYPQWSTQQLYIDHRGRLAYRATEQDGAGFHALIKDYHDRYQVPIIVTETSAFGSDELRSRWLEASVATIKQLRHDGVPVHGYTWFPLFTMIDWRYRFGRGPIDRYYLELGLFRLNRALTLPRWDHTPLVEQFKSYVRQPRGFVGDIEGGINGTHVAK